MTIKHFVFFLLLLITAPKSMGMNGDRLHRSMRGESRLNEQEYTDLKEEITIFLRKNPSHPFSTLYKLGTCMPSSSIRHRDSSVYIIHPLSCEHFGFLDSSKKPCHFYPPSVGKGIQDLIEKTFDHVKTVHSAEISSVEPSPTRISEREGQCPEYLPIALEDEETLAACDPIAMIATGVKTSPDSNNRAHTSTRTPYFARENTKKMISHEAFKKLYKTRKTAPYKYSYLITEAYEKWKANNSSSGTIPHPFSCLLLNLNYDAKPCPYAPRDSFCKTAPYETAIQHLKKYHRDFYEKNIYDGKARPKRKKVAADLPYSEDEEHKKSKTIIKELQATQAKMEAQLTLLQELISAKKSE